MSSVISEIPRIRWIQCSLQEKNQIFLWDCDIKTMCKQSNLIENFLYCQSVSPN